MENKEYIVTGIEIVSQPEDAPGDFHISGRVNGKYASAIATGYLAPGQAAALLIEDMKWREDWVKQGYKNVKLV